MGLYHAFFPTNAGVQSMRPVTKMGGPLLLDKDLS
jgi:hypothetical protein